MRQISWSITTAIVLLASPSMTRSVAQADDAAAASKPTKVSVFGEGELVVPAKFKRVEVQSRILEHEFQATAGEGDKAQKARVTMMAAGGNVADNIKRWNGQFAGGDPESQKSESMKIGNWQVHLVDVSGSYQERVGGGGPFSGGKTVTRENYGMTGAILVHPEGRKYFVKMIGPQTVIKENRKTFVEMIKSIDK